MSTSSLDIKYERELCARLLQVVRPLYKKEASSDLPTVDEVMCMKAEATPTEIRLQIQEAVDFLSVMTKYMMFDIEALKRESKKGKR